MRGKVIIIGVLVLLLVGICAASVYAVFTGVQMLNISGVQIKGLGANSVSVQATEEKLLQVDGPVSLNVQNDFGNILVSSSGDGQVRITAEKTAWGSDQQKAEAALKEVEVVVEQAGNTIKISVKRPGGNTIVIGQSQVSTVNFVVETPIQTRATLNSANGDVTVEGLTGNANVSSSFGKLEIRNLTGAVQASTSNGSINAEKLSGGQAISLESEFGSIDLTASDADEISLTTNNGAVTLSSVVSHGDLKVRSEFGEIQVKDCAADAADIQSSNGAIVLEQMKIKGLAVVNSMMGAITLTDVSAKNYDVRTANGKVSISGAANSASGTACSIKAQSSFGDVEVTDAKEAVIDISSDNGTLTFTGSLASGEHKLESNMGNIDLTIQPDAKLDLDLETSMGKISSDFAVTISGEINSSHWIGSINNGGSKLSASTHNGNITLNKSK